MKTMRWLMAGAGLVVLGVSCAGAATLTWNPAGSLSGGSDGGGAWDGATSNWWDGAGVTNWTDANPDSAIFGTGLGTAGTITNNGTRSVGGITFNSAGSGSYAITGGSLSLASPSTFTLNTNATISSVLTGGSLVKTGAGTLSLTGQETYSGATTVSGGTLSLASGLLYSAFGWGNNSISISNGATVVIGGWGDGATAGFGQVAFSSGNIRIDNGTIRYVGGYESGRTDRGFTIGAGGATLDAAAAWVVDQGRGFGLGTGSNVVLTLTGTATGTLNLVYSSGSLVKNGSGTWLLGGAHTFAGGSTISAGTIIVKNGTGTLGSGPVTLAGGNLGFNPGSTTNAYTYTNAISVNANAIIANDDGVARLAGPISIAAGSTLTAGTAGWVGKNLYFDGNISGGGALTLQGNGLTLDGWSTSTAGAMFMTGSNTYSGTTTLASGTLTMSGYNAIPGAVNLLASNSTLIVSTSAVVSCGTINLDSNSGGSSLTVNGSMTSSGGIWFGNYAGGKLFVSSTGMLNAPSSSAAWNPGQFQIDGNASLGAVSLTVAATATISGSGNFTNSSYREANSTTVNFTMAGNMVDNGNFMLGDASSQYGIFNQSAGTVTLKTTVADDIRIGHWGGETSTYNLSGGTWNVPGVDVTLGWDGNGVISVSGGTANLRGIKISPASHSGAGTITVTGGTLNIGAGGIYKGGTGVSTINLGPGTLGALANWTGTLQMTLANRLVIDSSTNTITLAGALGGTGTLTKTGSGKLALNATNTFSGTTTISNGTLAIGGAISNSPLIIVATNGVLDVSPILGNFALGNFQTLEGFGSVTGGVIANAGSKIAGGLLGTPGTLTFNGSVAMNAGSTNYFDLGSSTSTGNDSIVVNGDLTPNGSVVAINQIALLTNGTYNLFTYTGAKTNSFNPALVGVVSTSRRSITLDETNTPNQVNLVVAGLPANLLWNSPADTNWDNGTSTNWFNSGSGTGDVFFASDSVVFDDTPGVAQTVAINDVITPSSFAINTSTNAFAFIGSGRITGLTGLTKDGMSPMTMALNGTNDFSGPVSINNGTLIVSGSSMQPLSTGTIANNGALAFSRQNSFTFTNAITGGGMLVQNGPGTVTLSAPYTLTNTIAINGGSLAIPVAMNGGTSQAAILDNGNFTYSGPGGQVFGGAITGTGSFTTASGTVILTGSNTYSGVTTISSGILQVGNNNALGTLGSGNVVNNGYLSFHRTDASSFGARITGNGLLNIARGGSLTLLTGANITASQICLGDPNGQLGSGMLIVQPGVSVALSSGIMMGNQSGQSGMVTQNGGTITMAGATIDWAFRIGHWPSETSVYNLNGGFLSGSNIIATVGWDGGGIWNIAGGTAVMYGVQMSGGNNGTHGGASQLNFTGGRLAVGAGGFNFRSGYDTENMGGGTLVAMAPWTCAANFKLTGTNGDFTVDVQTNAVTLTGILTGTGGLIKAGSGTLTLPGTNTFSGALTISNGTLQLAGALTGGGAVAVNTGATLNLAGSLTAPASMKVGGNYLLAGTHGGSGGITIASNGTMTVTGAKSGGGDITILQGGALTATGTLAGGITSDGTIAIGGAQPSTLTVVNNLTLSSNSVLNIRLGSSSLYDQMLVGSFVTMDGLLNVTLVNGYVPTSGDTFFIIQSTSGTGTFATTNLPSLGTGLAWNLVNLGSLVYLEVVSVSPPASGYDAWAAQITNGQTNYNDSATGDGFANLLKYATGSNPTNSDDLARMNATNTSGIFALNFNRNTNATDVTLIVEGADGVANDTSWLGIATNIAGAWSPTNGVTETGSGSPVSVSVQDNVTGATNRFLRLRVTRP